MKGNPMKRRFFLSALTAVLALPSLTTVWADSSSSHKMMVFKSPTCGCCGEWVKIMKDAGFELTVRNVEEMDSIKKMASIPDEMQSCHTAKVGGYIVEGHVPVSTIKRLLSEKPDIRGISVPGMPFGSPGMGHNPEARYDVMTLPKTSDAKPDVYEKIGE